MPLHRTIQYVTQDTVCLFVVLTQIKKVPLTVGDHFYFSVRVFDIGAFFGKQHVMFFVYDF